MTTNSVVARNLCYGHTPARVLTKSELLAALVARGVKNVQMEKVLGLESSRVSEIMRAAPGYTGNKQPRELSYDEGVKLARAFRLDEDQAQPPPPQPLPEAILRLVARHMAGSLGADVSDDLLEDLTEDLRAFSVFVADPSVRKTLDMAEGFFRGMRLRRLADPEEVPPGSGPHHAH